MAAGRRTYYVGVIGRRTCSEEEGRLAFDLGRLMAEEGWILVCGGMAGIMEHACRGAVQAGGATIGILPGHSRLEGNPYLTYSVVTGLGEARNSIVVKSCEAVVAVTGGYGTLSEIAFANANRIPVIGLRSWSIRPEEAGNLPLFYATAETAEQAVEAVKKCLKKMTNTRSL